MRIQVVAPDPGWPAQFEREAAHINGALGGIVVAIHHMGSTSIPGVFAKPIIDILLEVSDFDAPAAISQGMGRLGYDSLGEFGIPRRRYFRKNDASGVRTHHVHAFVRDDPHVRRHLAFRDYLITHADAAAAYSTLKCELAARHPYDMEAYVTGKDSFIKEHEAKALARRRRMKRAPSREDNDATTLTAGKKAARTRKRRAAARKAALTRKRRAAARKAAVTRKRRAAATKAAATRRANRGE